MAPGLDRWLDRVLTLRRVRDFSIAIFAVNALLYAAVIARGRFPIDALGTAVLPDFVAHVTAGKMTAAGVHHRLYDVDMQRRFEQALTGDDTFLDLYLSPPLASFLYVPFALLSYATGAVAWTALTSGLLWRSSRVLRGLMPSIPAAEQSVLLIAAFASQPAIQLLGSGQDTGISLLVWCAGVSLALRRRDGAAGVVMSLGLFKPQLFFLPPLVFLALRRWRAVRAWSAGALVQGLLTLAVFDMSTLRGWWALLHSPEYVEFLRGERGAWMTSVMPFLGSIVPRGSPSAAMAASVVGGALSAAIVVATLWRGRAASHLPEPVERGVWAAACLATLLASPHLFYYDVTLLALPVALVVEIRRGVTALEKRALLAIALLTWTAAARGPLRSLGWPVSALAASWIAIPIFVLWRAVPVRAQAAPV